MKLLIRSIIITTLLLVFPLSGFAKDKYKIGVSVPSADHGWTAGLLWWAKKAVDDFANKDETA